MNSTRNDNPWLVSRHLETNPHKPEKLRRVCAAASKDKSVSLKDKVIAGPDNLQDLVGIFFDLDKKASL